MKLAVIGHPINHSKSPIIHNDWIEKSRLEGEYIAIDIAPNELEQEIRKLIEQGYDGFNITIPHKQNIMTLCSAIDESAKKIGAVNTVVINNGKLSGYNTDAFGFIQNIKENSQFCFDDKTAFVLGAGGAARAVIQGLIDENVCKIYLSNRTLSKAQELKSMAQDIIEVIEWDGRESMLVETDLLVNTTSLGMSDKNSLELNLTALKKSALVTDIVYAPLMTDLLKQAEKNGHKIVTGIGMLLYQAQKSFEIWTGSFPDVDEDLVKKVLA